MNSVSQANSFGLQNWAELSNNGTASSSSELNVDSYSSLGAELTIQTREGDMVTLSTSQSSQFEAYGYSRQGLISNEDGYAAAAYNVREITLTTGEIYSFTVEGDLSEKELEDVESIITGVDSIIGEMMEGNLQDAVSQAMRMGYYDSISSYEADITVQYGYAMYNEKQAATTGALEQNPALATLDDSYDTDLDDKSTQRTAGNLENSLMDQLSELLETQQEDALARARAPLSNLFDHYLETQEVDETGQIPVNEQEALTDERQVDKKQANGSHPEDPMTFFSHHPEDPMTFFSGLLKNAAKTVDRTIEDMVKNAFDNSLKSSV